MWVANIAGKEVDRLAEVYQEGYLVDNFKGRVALDVEWNAKDGNLDRDLSAYRAWHEAGVISSAVLITQDRIALKKLAERLWVEYQATLPKARRGAKLPIDLGTSTTTNLEKAALRVRRGVMGTCPLLIVAATQATWNGQPCSAA
ncbi:MAG: BglII/BstYI family type II restriction endonuclease [Rhodanobacteraceae bacterium]